MKRLALLAIVAVLTVGAGVGAWALTRKPGPQRPEISAYSSGHSTRVGPYRYCNVLDLTDCQNAQTQGELRVTSAGPVQLSVATAIGDAPWWLLTVYEDSPIPTTTFYRPGTRLAVTIPTVDPHHGRLTGIAVQLMTAYVDPNGEVQGVPHAEWSVRTVWG
ncbi:DUF2771 domain-containing protein [Candidatus Mycobacterium wuenschmannii]|uniref:DUF2771 domain-containing protein n=1 Tax=Candidatus Mycobacterium wuenschmannii TaxID=3027808 RepID=A0ABY8W5I9_9MYCO|nr:DUF2771 domain-containing protein [Candidatus Mycobacterium wuenschmannii]WIM90336.1 DUF2771 domain-containing protein [Candidatus Mycobacterium wuenschmannii]